ncbi:MAG: valine--tRNA ligase [Deltaproteobacteria bacterium]|nr:valine--tRNA ligase [Deltaproteobacteria bacterium]
MIEKAFDPAIAEKEIYAEWLRENLFHAADTSEKQPFSIVIPPPNVTGMLHMGHALNNTLQDLIIRFRRMSGDNTMWMPGTDHAGIATQNVVEKELEKEGKNREQLGREEFVERVWQWKGKYGGLIINQLKRLGSSCDWERERFTMDAGLSRAVREAFVRLYNDGLIYQGDYIVNWCPRCHTALSDLEVEYKETPGNLWHIRYPFADGSGEIIVATTRPETMLGDTAVAVNPTDARYSAVVGKKVILPLVNKEIPIIADDYVSPEFGSGAVKITPASDPNDFAMAERHHLEIVKVIGGDGTITAQGGAYAGQDRYQCRKSVVADLEAQGYLVKVEPYLHKVGGCSRCVTEVEPFVSRQWFVKMEPLAKMAIAAVVKGNTRIIPSMWEATYFDWLNNIRDWCISRQIWWGHRIPVWRCLNCEKIIVATDDPSCCPQCGESNLRQEEDVLDTWFSSALWPFSTTGWPEKTEALKTFYPTSLLITGFDILFFWVARMMMMGLYLMGDVPFRDVYLHALVRDEQGEKMSKSKGNVIDPLNMIDKYGADAFRFTLVAFTAQGRDVRMSEERIQGYKFFVNKIWNAARFTLINLEDFIPDSDYSSNSLPDRWIRSRLNKTIQEVTEALESYRFNDAAGGIYHFIWHELCDWYLELIKQTLYNKEDLAQRRATQAQLRTTFKTILQLLHPFMPFVTERLWKEFASGYIMVSDFPRHDPVANDAQAEAEMTMLQDVIGAIRNVRGEMGIATTKKLAVTVITEEVAVFTAGKAYIEALANCQQVVILDHTAPEPKGCATGVTVKAKVFVELGGMIDIASERVRLEKEVAKISKEIEAASQKLANEDFVQKASAAVVQKEEMRFQEAKEKLAFLQKALMRLKEFSS